MTNGEKFKEIFPNIIKYGNILIDDTGALQKNILFDDTWWNAEYKEPTTKNCESCEFYGSHHEVCNYCYKCSLWTEQEPTTKNDLVTLTFSKGTLKYSYKDYVVYKKEWLRSHYGAEIDIMFGDSQYKEPTTKNNLGVDAISRQALLNATVKKSSIWNHITNSEGDNLEAIVSKLPSVTPQEPILNKIRAEIEKLQKMCDKNDLNLMAQYSAFSMVLDILDKYKAETEEV